MPRGNYYWQVQLASRIVDEGHHPDKLEGRRALHRAIRRQRAKVIKDKVPVTGKLYRVDGVEVWHATMTPVTARNTFKRQIIVVRAGLPPATITMHTEGIRPT